MDEMTHFYQNHASLIHKEVWKACGRFPDISLDEILSEANEVFCRCYEKWTPKKRAKFSTYLTQALRNTLTPMYWYGSQSINGNGDGHDPEKVGVNGMCGPERLVLLKEALGQMTPLSVGIVNAVFYPPPLLRRTMREEQKSLVTKGVMRTYVRKDMGVSDANMITEAFSEIKKTLEEV